VEPVVESGVPDVASGSLGITRSSPTRTSRGSSTATTLVVRARFGFVGCRAMNNRPLRAVDARPMSRISDQISLRVSSWASVSITGAPEMWVASRVTRTMTTVAFPDAEGRPPVPGITAAPPWTHGVPHTSTSRRSERPDTTTSVGVATVSSGQKSWFIGSGRVLRSEGIMRVRVIRPVYAQSALSRPTLTALLREWPGSLRFSCTRDAAS